MGALVAQAYPKSEAELAKNDPAFKGDSNNWESLEAQYQIHVQMFQGYHQLTSMLLIPEIQNNLQDAKATANLAKGLASDITMLKNKTDKIRAKHLGKTGYSDDVDENFKIVMIFQEYATLIDQHQLLILPMVAQVNEQINYALNKIQELTYATPQAEVQPN